MVLENNDYLHTTETRMRGYPNIAQSWVHSGITLPCQ